MEMQAEPLSNRLEDSPISAEYRCADCGRRDETVRFVSYPYVFSLLVITFRRAFTGIWCGRHRFVHGSLACLITSIFGWLGIPWGFLYTPVALYQLARGGIKDKEANALILSTLGHEKLNKGDREGAIRCYEQSLRFSDLPATRETLKSLYAYNSLNETTEPETIRQFIVTFAIPLALYFVGILIGLVDYGFSGIFSIFLGEEQNVIVVIISWMPLALFLFFGIISLRKLLEWIVQVTKITSVVLVDLYVILCTVAFLYAVASGEAFARLFQYIYYGIQFDGVMELLLTLPTLVTRGGLYFLSDSIANGEVWGIIYVLLLLASGVLSLIVNVPLLTNMVRWQIALREIVTSNQSNAKVTPVGSWSALAMLSFGFLILSWLFPQQSYVDILTASDHYFAGLSYMQAEDLEPAVNEFEQAVQLRPRDINALLGLGYAYYYQEDFIHASEIFSSGLEIDPDSFDLLEAVGWVNFQLRDYDEAEKNFNAALSIFPESFGSHLGLGWIYLEEDPEASINEFNSVLSQFPDEANAHLGLGIAYYILRDYEHAKEELQIAAKDDFNKALAYFSLGNLYLAEREYEFAIDAYSQALAAEPDYYDAQMGMVDVYMTVYDFEQAFQSLEKAIALQPENPLGFIYLSGVYSWQGEYKQSLSEIENALKFDPENKMAHAIKSSILYRLGQEDAAEAELKRMDEIESVDYQTAYIVATVLTATHRYEDAISYLEKAVQSLPGGPHADYYSSLAGYYSALGKYDQAQQAIEAAIKLDAMDPAIYVTQGLVYIDQENLDAAEKHFQKALDLDPKDSDAHAGLSFIHLQLGNSEKAAREAELAVQSTRYSRPGYESLAFSYHALGRLEDAIIAAEESLRLDPTRNLSHYILGVCFMEKGMNEEAIQEFEKFLHYYYDRAYVREYKLKAEEYLSALRSLP